MGAIVEMLLDFFNAEKLVVTLSAVFMALTGAFLLAGGYFFEFTFIDDLTAGIGAIMLLAGPLVGVYQLEDEDLL